MNFIIYWANRLLYSKADADKWRKNEGCCNRCIKCEYMEKIFQEWMNFAVKAFPKATKEVSLEKLQDELKELKCDWSSEEYVDCIMCLLHSAAEAGHTGSVIQTAFISKMAKNKSREWKINDNNTYSHVK